MPADVHALISLIRGISNHVLSGHMLQSLGINSGIKKFFRWCCTAVHTWTPILGNVDWGFVVSSLPPPDSDRAWSLYLI